MGIIDQLIHDFYDKIRSHHILLLAGLDVDTVCACKILQALFKADNVQYTLVPVSGKLELQQAFTDHASQLKVIIMINCGGSFNILDHLQPEEGVQFFIIDSHRPLELDNVYNAEQVNIVVHESEEFDFPQFDDIYASDMESGVEEEEYFSDEEGDEPDSKRRKTDIIFERRKKKHVWKKKREDILFKYKEFSYHGTAASLVMHELALKLSRESNEIIWWAIIGLTEQFLYEKIEREKYVDHVHRLQPHVLRLNRSEEESSSVNSMKLTFDNELRLVLYRHWTLYDSLCHSEYVSCRFKTWTMKGHKKYLEFLADMGLPLIQSKQRYSAMDVQIRDNLRDWMVESARKFGMEDMTYGSFVAQMGYKHHFCAADIVYCITALLEHNIGATSTFLSALDTLTKGNLDKVTEGLELAKQQQLAIVNQVRSFTDMHQVVCAGPFIYAYVEEGTVDSKKWFSNPLTLGRLARYLRETWTATNKKARDYPFIVCSPVDESKGTCVVVGVPPHADDSHKSEFHNAFVQASERVQARTVFNYFDGSVIQIQVEDRGKFFDALSALSLY